MSIQNAKTEFIQHTQGREVSCARITFGDADCGDSTKTVLLLLGHTEQDKKDFLRSLDQTYYDGYGGQELFGTIWYSDGTWSERGEYDGSEWWEYKKCPPVPECMHATKTEPGT